MVDEQVELLGLWHLCREHGRSVPHPTYLVVCLSSDWLFLSSQMLTEVMIPVSEANDSLLEQSSTHSISICVNSMSPSFYRATRRRMNGCQLSCEKWPLVKWLFPSELAVSKLLAMSLPSWHSSLQKTAVPAILYRKRLRSWTLANWGPNYSAYPWTYAGGMSMSCHWISILPLNQINKSWKSYLAVPPPTNCTSHSKLNLLKSRYGGPQSHDKKD